MVEKIYETLFKLLAEQNNVVIKYHLEEVVE